MLGVSLRWIKIYSSVIIISLVSKLTGLLRDALIAARFGATLVTDAYVVALLIPEVIFNVFGNSLSANFTPLYYESERRRTSRQFVSTLFSLYLLLSGLIFFFFYRHTGFLITIFSSGFSGMALATTTLLLKIFLANIFFITLTYFCLAYLQAHNQFLLPSTIGIVYNLAIIASMCYPGRGNSLYILIVGTLAGYIAQFAIQMPQALARGLPPPAIRLTISPEIKQYAVLSIPVAVLAILGQLNIAMDNFFASRLNEGSITTMNLGYRSLMGIYSLFITNTMMIVYPVLSKSIVEGEHHHTAGIIQKTANLLIVLLLPLSLYLFVNSGPIIDLMFMRGAFTGEKSSMTALVFQGYILGLIFYAFRDLLLRYFFAVHSAVIPMFNGVVNSSLNLAYLLLLVPRMGLPGVSLATALSAISSSFVLFLVARKHSPAFRQLRLANLAAKTALCSAAAIGAAALLEPRLYQLFVGSGVFCQLLRIGTGFLVFCMVYVLLLTAIFNKKIFGFFAGSA